MKTIFKMSLVLCFLITSASVFANRPYVSVLRGGEKGSLIFKLDAPAPDTSLELTDSRGNQFYFDLLKGVKPYGKKFDMKGLEPGNYFLKVTDEIRETVYTIRLDNDGLTILGKVDNVKPYFRKKGKRIYMNFLNTEGSDVAIRVLDSNNRVVFEETRHGELVIEKALNFEGAFKDEYTVVVKTGNKTFSKRVLVD